MRALILLLLCLIVEEISAQGSPQFVFDRSEINIYGLDSDINSIAVYADSLQKSELSTAQEILGKASQINEGVKYIPLVPLSFETPYTLVYNDYIKHFLIQLPEDYERMTVVAIHPSSKELPSNLLKWYVEFSRPVNPTNIYDYIFVVDHLGNYIDRAVLPLESALLSDDGKLLTIWMEPGRQKRGLLPNKDLGAILEEGKSYQLFIDNKLKDSNGERILSSSTFDFTVIPADRLKPDIGRWDFNIPSASTDMTLRIDMDESMDYGSLLNHVQIQKGKENVAGRWKLYTEEQLLLFIPEWKWDKGNYLIAFDPTIEDLAGNNLLRLFDSNIDENKDPSTIQTTLEFVVK